MTTKSTQPGVEPRFHLASGRRCRFTGTKQLIVNAKHSQMHSARLRACSHYRLDFPQ